MGDVAKTEGKQTLADMIGKMSNEIKKVIPQHITPERLARTFLTACQKNPKLLQCTSQSLLKAYMDAGEIGLEPDGINAHLIPYGTVCTYMADYKGYIKLARLSGEVSDMTANAVYSNDEFSHEYGSNKHLKHIKTLKKDRGDRIAAYSYVKYKDGSEDFRVLTETEIMNAKKSSKSDNIWRDHPDAMWAKTAIRQHAKFLPRHQALQVAAMADEKIDMELTDIDISDVTALSTENRKDDLKKKIEEKQAKNKTATKPAKAAKATKTAKEKPPAAETKPAEDETEPGKNETEEPEGTTGDPKDETPAGSGGLDWLNADFKQQLEKVMLNAQVSKEKMPELMEKELDDLGFTKETPINQDDMDIVLDYFSSEYKLD